MRALATAFLRLMMRIFFRHIELVGLENLPPGRSVIFACNHPNGLVDPLFIVCFAPRPVSFLGKAPLWRYPVVGWFVRVFDSIPVYRKQDQVAGTNQETFSRAREVLGRGGAIAIFPEGTTHSDSQLRELKTGAARIALGAAAQDSPAGAPLIIPAGIYYTAKQRFRSSALLLLGAPIVVQRVVLDADGEPPREAAEALTAQIETALDEVTLQADSRQALSLIARAERIFSGGGGALAGELDLRRRFVDGYHYLRERDPQRLAALESRVARFESEMHAARLDPETLEPAPRGISWKTAALLLLLAPLAAVGGLLHYPTYRLIGLVAITMAKGEREMTATIKVLAALVLFPLTWMVVAALTWWRLGFAAALAALALLPLLGYAALQFFERLDDVIGRTRSVTRRIFVRHAFNRLLAERDGMRGEMVAVAEEMERREV
jgi:glycerol-3-phosphate O-acyltransferase/dihydroxyacetone phosphate acyltransferase